MDNEIFPTFKILKDIKRPDDFIEEFPIEGNGKVGDNNLEKNFIGSSFNKKNLNFFLMAIFILLGFLFFRTGYLQIIKGEYYFNIAEGNRIKTESIKAKRGVMYDRNGFQLVYNRPNFFLTIIPKDFFLSKHSEIYKNCKDSDIKCKILGKEIILNTFKNKEKKITSEYLEKIFSDIDIKSSKS